MADIRVPDGFSREELLACIDREIKYRVHVFPKRVDAGKMSGFDARRELARMAAVRAVLAQLPPTQAGLPFDARSRAAGEDP